MKFISLFIFFLTINFHSYASNLCDEFYEGIREEGKKLALYEPYNDNIGVKVSNNLEKIKKDLSIYNLDRSNLYEIYNIYYDEFINNGYINKSTYEEFTNKFNINKNKLDLIIELIDKNTNRQIGVVFLNNKDGSYFRDNNNNIVVYSIEPNSNLIEIYNELWSLLSNIEKQNEGQLKLVSINNEKISDLDDDLIDQLLEENELSLGLELNSKSITKVLSKSSIKPRVEIYPSLEILSINNIDEKNSSFEISYILNSTWYDERFINIIKDIYQKEFGSVSDIISNSNSNNITSKEAGEFVGGWYCELNSLEEIYQEDLFMWLPEMDIINKNKSNIINEVQTLKLTYTYWSDGEEIMEISFSKQNDLILNTKFNFRSYPFDKQNLDIYLALIEDYSNSVALYPSDDFNIGTNNYENLFTWKVNPDDISINYFQYKDIHDGMKISLTAERNANYFVYKVLSPIFLILLVCWSVLFIHPRQIESRLTVSIVCFLTLIAYNFVIDQDLPKLGYLTLIDYIVLLSYIYSALPTVISIFEYKYSDDLNIIKINNRIRIIGLFSYILLFYFFLNISSNNNENINSFIKAITL